MYFEPTRKADTTDCPAVTNSDKTVISKAGKKEIDMVFSEHFSYPLMSYIKLATA